MKDEIYIRRCLELAKLGFPDVLPNPIVGCVIVHKSKIIGEGYHRSFGGKHAEDLAITSVNDKRILKNSTLYTNLEPCSHYGKTPPCAVLIVKSQIPQVVISNLDPNMLVSGKGIEILEKAKIEVGKGVLEKEAFELNKRFMTFHQKKRPYIILKWAETNDRFIADDELKSKWISNEYSRTLVHKWRSEEQAILVGTRTVEIDNPRLDVRSWSGKNPIRMTIDKDLILSKNSKLFNKKAKTLIFNQLRNSDEDNLEYIKIDFNNEILESMLKVLFNKNITSIIIEGGSDTIQKFVEKNLWDEARVFVSDKIFKSGLKAPVIKGVQIKSVNILNDQLKIFRNSE